MVEETMRKILFFAAIVLLSGCLENNEYHVDGVLRLGHEVRSFENMADCKEYWIVDKSGKLMEKYKEVIGSQIINNQPIQARLKVKNLGKMSEGFGAEYDGAYEVIEIEDLSKNVLDICRCGNKRD